MNQKRIQMNRIRTRNTGEIELDDTGRIWVLSSKTNKWRECLVVDENVKEIRVHYISYNSMYDEWISRRSKRLSKTRPVTSLEVRDNLSVWCNDLQAWIEGEIATIDDENNRVQISYIGVLKQEWIDKNDSRLSVVHKELGIFV